MNIKKTSLVLFLSLALFSCAKKEIQYQTFEVVKQDLVKKIEVNGSVESNNVVDIYAPVPGRLERMLVKEGDLVRARQKIATMSSESRSQIIDMAAAKGKAEIDYWKSQMLTTPIYSPVAGKIIVLRAFNAGERISGSVGQVSTGEVVRANLDESDLPSVKLGQAVNIQFDIHSKNSLTGTLEKISQVSKLVNNVNVYQVEVSLPPEEGRKKMPFEVKIGMSVTLFFSIQEKLGAKALSVSAVNGRSNDRVNVLKENGVKTKIKLGDIYGDWVEVVSGLELGDKIKIPAFQADKNKTRK